MGTREGTKDIPKGMSICPVPSLSLASPHCPEFVPSLSYRKKGGDIACITRIPRDSELTGALVEAGPCMRLHGYAPCQILGPCMEVQRGAKRWRAFGVFEVSIGGYCDC